MIHKRTHLQDSLHFVQASSKKIASQQPIECREAGGVSATCNNANDLAFSCSTLINPYFLNFDDILGSEGWEEEIEQQG